MRRLPALVVIALVGAVGVLASASPALSAPAQVAVSAPARVAASLPARPATAAPQHRLVVFAASAKYLVYGHFAVGHPSKTPGTLFVQTAAGTRTSYGQIPPSPGDRVSLAGPMIVLLSAHRPHAVQWWNLANATSGSSVMSTAEYPVAATPTGWLFLEVPTFGPTDELEMRSTDGTTTALSTKWNAGIPTVDATRVLVQDKAGATAVMLWSAPGVFTPLISHHYVRTHFSGGGVYCSSVNAKVAACLGTTDAKTTMIGAPLGGGSRVSRTVRCDAPPADPTAFGRSVVWNDKCNGLLKRLLPNGRTNASTRHYATDGVWHGLHGIVALAPSNRTIYRLETVGAKPLTLVQAR